VTPVRTKRRSGAGDGRQLWRVARPRSITAVDLDFAAAGSLAVDHLADLRHRVAGFVGQPSAVYGRGTSYAPRMLSWLRSAAKRHRIQLGVAACDSSLDGLQACIGQLLADQPGMTGQVVHNEAVLPSLADALRQRRKQIPKDISLVTICPDDMAENHAVAYTNIAIRAEEPGTVAVDMLTQHLDGKTTTETRLLSPVLTVRSSTALASR
jgi:DNA-binding LacI/PurR family transcriptional regulator